MKLWIVLLTICLTPVGSAVLRADEVRPLLQKPAGDAREYQHVELANGLRVVNIRDPNSTQAAVAVAVTVGSFSDPEGLDGLAHLLEHSMFLGSKSFPERSGFDSWLAEHGGSSNAYTAEEQTVYYAAVNSKALKPCLRRYADIFRAPLFNASWIWEEVSAVDSEHNKNRKSQEWRVQSLINHVAGEGPMSRFHTGNAKTLRSKSQEQLGSALRQFFTTNYCPPRMRLVSFGPMSLKKQLEEARETFGRIPRRGWGCQEEAPSFDPAAFPSSGAYAAMQGLSPQPELHLVFPMADLRPWVRSNPCAYLQHLLGYAGNESLLVVLRDELEVASSVEVGQEDSTAGSKIIVSMSLLPEGVERLPVILDAFFAFLARARRRSKTETSAVLRSLQESAKLGYDWSGLKDASSAASDMADDMTRLGPSDLLVAGKLILEPSVEKVEELMERLRPERLLLVLVDSEKSSAWRQGVQDARSLPYYDVNYTVRPLELAWPTFQSSQDKDLKTLALDQRLLEVVSKSLSLSVPGAIEGLPRVAQAAAPVLGKGLGQLWGASPRRLKLPQSSDLWHRESWMLRHPRVSAQLILRRPQEEEATASDVVNTEIGLRMLNERLSDRLANLSEVGTAWRVEGGPASLSFYMSSFTGAAKEHFAQVLAEVKHVEEEALASKRLKRMRNELKMEYEDQSEALMSVALRERSILLMPQAFAREELLEALGESPSVLQVQRSLQRQGQLAVTGLVMGSTSEQQAQDLQALMLRELVDTEVEVVPSSRSERVERVLHFRRPMELRGRNPRGDRSHAMLMSVMVGVGSLRTKLLLGLVSEVLNQVAFAYLRTELQLGYMVGGSVSSMSNVITVSCFVQSESALPDLAEQRCEEVLALHVVLALEHMGPEDFASVKESFRLALLQPPLSTSDELERFWEPIRLGGCFDASEQMLEYLKHVRKEEILTAWRKAVLPSEAREKVVIKLFGGGQDPSHEGKQVRLPKDLAEHLRKERLRTRVLQGPFSAAKRRATARAEKAGYYAQTLSCSGDVDEDSTAEESEDEVKASFLRRE